MPTTVFLAHLLNDYSAFAVDIFAAMHSLEPLAKMMMDSDYFAPKKIDWSMNSSSKQLQKNYNTAD